MHASVSYIKSWFLLLSPTQGTEVLFQETEAFLFLSSFSQDNLKKVFLIFQNQI